MGKFSGTFFAPRKYLFLIANTARRAQVQRKAAGGVFKMQSLLNDLRYGARILARNPGFAIAAVICLALGIGATTAIFSVVNAVLLRPLPYVQPQRLVKVYSEFGNFPGGGLKKFWVSPPEYIDLKRETKSWESLDGWVNGGANIAGQSQPVRVTASFDTGG
jgi:hypothetical protein